MRRASSRPSPRQPHWNTEHIWSTVSSNVPLNHSNFHLPIGGHSRLLPAP